MKPIHILLLVLFAVAITTPAVSAATTNITGGASITCKGAWPLVSLGIERFVPVTSAMVYYNWISIGLIVMLGAMASARTTRFIALLIPVIAALLIFLQWFTPASSAHPAQLWGIVVFSALLAVAAYMKGSLHEKFGISGPGSMLFNVVFFIIILQATVGFVNGLDLWQNDTGAVGTTSFSNIDLKTEIETTSTTGGGLNDLIQAGAILLDMAYGVILMFISMGLALIGFSAVLAFIYPWIPATTEGTAFLVLLQIGIYIIYYMAYMRMIYKPVGEGDF